MIKKIKITGCSLKERTSANNFEMNPLTVLYACNGSGKSSLLKAIANHQIDTTSELIIEGNIKKIAFYKNSSNNHSRAESNSSLDFNVKAIDKFFSGYRSEGENIMISILSFIQDVQNDKEVDVVLMDEVDSGLSVEHVNIIFHHISEMVKNNKQVIFTCNTYHPIFITRNFTNMMSGKSQVCNSYEEFYGVAVESRNILIKQDKIPKYYSV